ncbi:MAG: glycoside hydrolase family 43 protein [Treponema sp.]|nr:glycoside hydrolase family 43 protein [Treponema sp.]
MASLKTVRVNNPILTGFHPDPSICMANGEYFIANSTFEWYPGVEISRSKDLVQWTSVPSPLSEKRLLDMNGEKFSCGIWAPCLSYSDGLFWLIYTNVRNWNVGPQKDCPNFLTTAPSIEGPWSDPVFLNASGFDASMFHDDDGRHWYVNMEWDYRKTGPRQFSGIVMREYDPKTKTLGEERHKIFLGTDIGLVEGPHLYKKDGLYYIAAAEGGTSYEHSLTVARSKSIFGPYEVHPQNPLISSYGRMDLKIQKAGHGSWCSSVDGKRTYLVYLCGRPLPGTLDCVLGRETAFAELEWKDGWPYIKQTDGSLSNIPPDYVDVPVENEVVQSAPGWGKCHYTFAGEIHPDFKTLRTPACGRYSLTARPGWLRMYGGQSPWSFYEQSIFCRRQTDFKFTAETKIEFEPDYFQQYAGMCYRYDEETQYLLQITHSETRGKILQLNQIMPPENGCEITFVQGMEVELEKGAVWLRLEVDYKTAWFSWSQDGKNFRRICPICEPAKLSDEFGGLGFTGAFVGMFCVDTEFYKKPADFEYFDYIGLDKH